MTIGEKIRELRRGRDMTQEELASALGVAYQTVSKWETGATSPDLGLIVPIARLFRVTTDELFDYSENADKARLEELDAQYQETFHTGDLRERMAISEQAVKEFPSDMMWLCRYGWDIWCDAIILPDKEAYRAAREKAIGIFQTVIEREADMEIKAIAIDGIVQCLCYAGKKAEALEYAEMLPDIKYPLNKKQVIRMKCLEGEEQKRERQRYLNQLFFDLFGYLTGDCWSWRFDEFSRAAAETAIKLVKLFFPDGDCMNYANDLSKLYLRLSEMLVKEGNEPEAEACLRNAFDYARQYDSIQGSYDYTSPLFSMVTGSTDDWAVTGQTTAMEDLASWLSGPGYAEVRQLGAYKELFGETDCHDRFAGSRSSCADTSQ